MILSKATSSRLTPASYAFITAVLDTRTPSASASDPESGWDAPLHLITPRRVDFLKGLAARLAHNHGRLGRDGYPFTPHGPHSLSRTTERRRAIPSDQEP